ncbi:hypothetical protein E4U19_004812 [Claviceps sp. Clav32 group G5]|nr:hypothetical protein E4U19_004812 [Claviceps sp. Clav32 group G5]
MMQTNTPRQAQKQKSFSDPKVHQPPQPPRNNDAEKRSTRNLPENRQTRTEEILVKLTEGLTNLPSKVCDEFMERCVESEKQLVTKSKEAEELRSEVQSLKEQLQQQKADSQDKVEQLETKSTEAKGLRSELQSLKEQLQHQKADNQEKVAELITTIQGLGEDKRKLREVILGNALRHEVSDDEIRQRFVNIRQQIQAVVNNPALNKTRKFMPSAAGNSPMFRLYRDYNSYSPEDRVFLMRSAVYQIICHFILGRDAFGLAEPVLPFQYNREAQLDQFLGDFEGLLRTKKVTNEVISDWRLATFKCIESFSATPHDNSNARGEIRHFLFPLVSSERNLLEIAAEINRLCDDAFALRLLTRKSGDRYHFDGPTRGVECVPAKGNVEICAVLGGGEVSKYVAFSICGALIKKTGNEESEVTCVLEPAHVVVQAKESGKSPHLTRDFGRSDVR